MPSEILGLYTISGLVKLFGVDHWQVQKILAADKALWAKVGAARVVQEKDLPRAEAALRAAGYIKAAKETPKTG